MRSLTILAFTITFGTFQNLRASFWDSEIRQKTRGHSSSANVSSPRENQNLSTYRELSYDDLVQEYHATKAQRAQLEIKQSRSKTERRAFAGALVSFANYQFEEQQVQASHQGFHVSYEKQFQPQISWGLQYKNMPSVQVRNFRIEAQEVDGLIHYSNELDEKLSAQLTTGIASRLLTVEQEKMPSTNLSLQFIIGAGIYYEPRGNWVLGVEPQAKSSLLTKTGDRTAFDLNFKLGARF